jgi:hypothetical protein
LIQRARFAVVQLFERVGCSKVYGAACPEAFVGGCDYFHRPNCVVHVGAQVEVFVDRLQKELLLPTAESVVIGFVFEGNCFVFAEELPVRPKGTVVQA